MHFERDIFISYAHIDNQPISAGEMGWITRFHDALQRVLSMRIARKVEIWRDAKLQGNDVFSDEIFAQLDGTAAMVAIVSPRYLESTWCRDEVAEFCRRAEASMGLMLGNKARVLKVTKLPVRRQDPLPLVMQQTLGVDFYEYDAQEVAFELDPAFGPDKLLKFNVKVVHVAEQIRKLLEHIDDVAKNGASQPAVVRDSRSNAEAETADSGDPVIYLAECSYDLRDTREQLQTELRMRGCTVLPERELPRQEHEYVEEVGKLLARASLSIHLVGAQFGAVPDGPGERSVTMLQNDLAAARSRTHGLPRIIWLPRGRTIADQKHAEFVSALQRDAATQVGADLITGDVEALQAEVASLLHEFTTKTSAADTESPEDTGSAQPLLYLIFDARDRDARTTPALRRYLDDAGVAVVTPLFSGDATTLREAHLAQLERADAVMVFYGEGSEMWKRAVDEDLRKATGRRRGRRVPEPLTFVHGELTPDKQDLLDMASTRTIDARSGTPIQELKAIVRRMQGHT